MLFPLHNLYFYLTLQKNIPNIVLKGEQPCI